MANETVGEPAKATPRALAPGQQVERAVVAPDGTVTIPHSEGKLQFVDVADVDMLLGFTDGTYVVIPNGALEAISDTPHPVIFSDNRDSLNSLFKMVGTSNPAKAGSLRVVSEDIDAANPPHSLSPPTDDLTAELPIAPAPMAKVGMGMSPGVKGLGKGAGLGGTGEGEGLFSAPIVPLVTQQIPVYRIGQKGQPNIPDSGHVPGSQSYNLDLYTSSNYKVTPAGTSDLPPGAYDPAASPSQLAERASNAKQSAVETINGTSGNDTIVFNPAFSSGEGQWSKTLHLSINNYSAITSIQLDLIGNIANIPGFDLKGLDGVVVTRDSPTSSTWHVTPSADMLMNGANIALVYNVVNSSAVVDFDIKLTVSGLNGLYQVISPGNYYNFTWRDAVTQADYDAAQTSAGVPLLVLPNGGVGVIVNAGDGDDTVSSGAGDDVLNGGLGADVLNGGTGNDTATYENATTGITARLDTNGVGNTGEASGDTYTSIENLMGSTHNDILIGDGNANILTGSLGDDVLEGMAGADILIGGANLTDINNPLDANNTASYAHAGVGITASLTDPTANTGDAQGDLYYNIQNLTGSGYSDTLIGDANANVLTGGLGDDVLEGMAGADILIGGANLTDINNPLDANNTASYAHAGAVSGSVGITASLTNPLSNTGDALGDSYYNIQNLTGSSYNDTLIGDSGNNILSGGSGNDILEGMNGADQLVGGSGVDTASYAHASTFVAASLTTGLSGFNSAGDALGDTFNGIENLTGSNYSDTLIGDSNDNILSGGDGNDILEGMNGADSLIGGNGSNTASYEHAGTAVTANLGAPGSNSGDASGDTYTQIQNLTGSGFSDTLIGDSAGNTLTGGGGDDILEGMAGGDQLVGGASLTDINNPLDANNTASYEHAATFVAASLTSISGFNSSGDAQSDTYINIQNLTGSNYNDALIGDIHANTLTGGGGDDILEGLSGADALIGGTGNNTASYEHAGSGLTVSLTTPSANTGDAAGDTFSQIQNLTGSNLSDNLTGDGGSNILNGGAADDVLEGLGNADILIGGTGTDTASYAHAGSYVMASLTSGLSGFTSAGDAAGDTFTSVENLTGSDYNDTLIGDTSVNTILGGLGDDILEGIGGGDSYDGGSGSNTVSYAHAPDTGLGVGVTASLLTPASNLGSAAGDQYTNILNLTGSAFNDTLTGDGNNNILTGGAGNDTLTGGAGTDTLYGGTGNDTLIDDGAGIAKLYGEDGDDIFRITSADANVDIIDGGDKSALRLSGAWSGTGDTISWESTNFNRIDVDMINHQILLRSPVSGNDISFVNVENFTVTGNNTIYATLDNYSNTIDATSNGTANTDYVLYQNALGSISADLRISNGINVTGGSSVLDNYNATTHTWSGTGDTLKGIEYIYSGSYYADNIYGSDGVNNWLAGSLGADYINGGSGTDTVYLDPGRSQTVVASLLTAAQNTAMGIVMTDTAQGDVYVNMENLYSSGIDQLYGNAGSNVLSSNGAMEGFVGADSLVSLNNTAATASYADAGNTYLAGLGITTAAGTGVIADLTNPGGASFTNYFTGVSAASGLGVIVANTGDAAGDTYSNNMYGLTGSAYNDILIGNALNNTITANGGDDLMEGMGGADSFNGGAGTDTVSYAHATSGVIMDLGTSGLYVAVGQAGVASDAVTVSGGLVTAVDTFTSVENVIGSTFNDTLAGNSLDNVLNGGAGNDFLDGGANTAGGFDIASYAYTTAAVTVNLGLSGPQNTISAGIDTLINIEGLLGSDSNDTLTGDSSNNWIDGGQGSDTLDGGAGTDTLAYTSATGGVTVTLNGANSQGDLLSNFENLTGSLFGDYLTGDGQSNVIEGDLGNDTLDGGLNTASGDTVSYAHATAGVTVNLAITGTQNTIAAGIDTISNFENLTGSDYGDTLTGNAGINIITGGLGDDLLIASNGGDTLAGGVGTMDTVSFAGSGAVTVTINATAVHDGFTDILTGMENLIGSSNDDIITGDGSDNIIDGGTGDDAINGGAGMDTITYANAGGAVTVDLSGAGINVSGAYGNDSLTYVENLIGSSSNDHLTGDGNANIIEGGGGDDIMNGLLGTDTASYSSAGSGVTVSLAISTAQNTGGAGSDTLSNFENLTGSAYNDVLTGNAGPNILDGGAGDDLLIGGIGADTLNGGTGTDTVSYTNAGSSVVMTLGRTGLPAATGDAVGDTFNSIENIVGSNYNDTLGGSTGNNTITGGLGDDTVYASDGNDVIYANQGHDTAYGENSNDTFYVSSLTANLPTIIDGGGRDAGNVQNNGGNVMVLQDLVNNGSYNMTALAGLNSRLVNIDTLNIRDGASTAITIGTQDIQNMVDNGNSSQLYVEANNGDTLNVTLAAGETQAVSTITSAANGSTYTDYTIFNASNVQVAQVHWHSS